MKPEDLKSPFRWEQRRVLFQDRVLYVPDYYDRYDEFSFPGWDDPAFFGNHNPVNVEYCSGNGAWVAGKAAENPAINWVAVEQQFVRARKIWSKIKNHNLNNLIVICGEAATATSHYFTSESINEVYINFPDPWPKQRHAKNRLIRPSFIQDVWRILQKGKRWTFVTDDPDYSELLLEEMGSCAGFSSCYPAPHYVTDYPGYGTSYFDQLWREKGKLIRYHQFQKQAP